MYVFGDAQQWELGTMSPEDIALTVTATVVSHAGGRAVLDAGSKVLGADRAAYATGFGRLLDHPDARITGLSEHHAVVDLAGAPLPRLGETVRVVPNHVCAAVNLADDLWVEEAGDPAPLGRLGPWPERMTRSPTLFPMSRRLMALPAALLALSFLVAGCGGDDDKAEDPGSSDTGGCGDASRRASRPA